MPDANGSCPAISETIRAEARALGFDDCRFARLEDAWPAAARLHEFISLDRHGEMDWMAATAERREHPQAMWPDARSAIAVSYTHGPDADPLEILGRRDRPHGLR